MPVQDEILRAIDAAAECVIEVSRQIHAHPELRFQEHFAAKTLSDALEAFGIAAQQPIGGLDTALRLSSAARQIRRWRFSRNTMHSRVAMPVAITSSLAPHLARPWVLQPCVISCPGRSSCWARLGKRGVAARSC